MSRPSQLGELRQRIRTDLRAAAVEQSAIDDIVLATNEIVSVALRTEATGRPRSVTVQWIAPAAPVRSVQVAVTTPDEIDLDADDSIVANMLRELAERLNVETRIGGTVIRLWKSVHDHVPN